MDPFKGALMDFGNSHQAKLISNSLRRKDDQLQIEG